MGLTSSDPPVPDHGLGVCELKCLNGITLNRDGIALCKVPVLNQT